MPRFPTSGPQCRCRRSGRPDTAAACSPRWLIYQSPLKTMPTRPRAHRVSMTHVRRRGPVNCRVPHAGAADRFSTCECGSIDARRIRSVMPRLAACGAKREPAWAPQSKHAADGPGPGSTFASGRGFLVPSLGGTPNRQRLEYSTRSPSISTTKTHISTTKKSDQLLSGAVCHKGSGRSVDKKL